MKRGKRCLAALLIVVLVFANAGPMAWAGESKIDDKVLFIIEDSELISEIKEAAAGRFEIGDVEFQTMDGDAEMFWETFVEGGGVYELEPRISGGKTNVNLRLFVRLPDLPEDIEEEYQVTGEEEILLLYSNGTPGKVSCQTEIIGEHIRRTRPVTLSGHKDLADDDGNEQGEEEPKENIETDNPDAAKPEDSMAHISKEKTEQGMTGSSSETWDREDPPAQADEAEPPGDAEEIDEQETPVEDMSGEDVPGTQKEQESLQENQEENKETLLPAQLDEPTWEIILEEAPSNEVTAPKVEKEPSAGVENVPTDGGDPSAGGEASLNNEGDSSGGRENPPKEEENSLTGEGTLPKGEENFSTDEGISPEGREETNLASGSNSKENNTTIGGGTEAPKPNPATGSNSGGSNAEDNDAGDYKQVSDQIVVDDAATVKLCVIALEQLTPLEEEPDGMYRYENEELVVVAELPEDTPMPANIKLKVEAVGDLDYLEARRKQFAGAYGGDGKALDLYRIGFYAESGQDDEDPGINEISEDAGEYRAESDILEDPDEEISPSESVTEPEGNSQEKTESVAGESKPEELVPADDESSPEESASEDDRNRLEESVSTSDGNSLEGAASGDDESDPKDAIPESDENGQEGSVPTQGTAGLAESIREPSASVMEANSPTEPGPGVEAGPSEESVSGTVKIGPTEPQTGPGVGSPAGEVSDTVTDSPLDSGQGVTTPTDPASSDTETDGPSELIPDSEVNKPSEPQPGPEPSVPMEPIPDSEINKPSEPQPDPEPSVPMESIPDSEINNPLEPEVGPGANISSNSEVGPGVNPPAESIPNLEGNALMDPISDPQTVDGENIEGQWLVPCEANIYMRFKNGLEIEDAVCVFRFREGDAVPSELSIIGIDEYESEKNRISILAFKTDESDGQEEEVLEIGILKQRKLVHTGGEGTMPYQMAGLPLAIGAGCAVLYCDMSGKKRRNLLPIRRRTRKPLFGIRKARSNRTLWDRE